MPHQVSLGAKLAIHVTRYLAASQAFAMVFFHAGWMLLSVATWGHLAGPDSEIGTVTRVLMRAYAWLGGLDASGYGDANSMMVVWAKIALAIYALESLWRLKFGRRAPMKLWLVAGISWLVAQVGYVFALLPTGALGATTLILVLFPLLAGAATAWSVAAHRFADIIVDRLERGRDTGQRDTGQSAIP
jgi:hypothetical protein